MNPRQFLSAILVAGYLTVLAAPALAQMPGMEPPEEGGTPAKAAQSAAAG